MYYYSEEPNYNEDYNYPSLNRKDLMSLDTIKEKDFPRKKINQINSKRDWSKNLYNLDIDKSYSKKNDIYLNKVDFINKIDDIEKARPTKEKLLIKPNYILNVRDIEKAYPKKERHFYGKAQYNSLENKLLVNQYESQKNKSDNYEKNLRIYNNILNNDFKNNYNNRYNNNENTKNYNYNYNNQSNDNLLYINNQFKKNYFSNNNNNISKDEEKIFKNRINNSYSYKKRSKKDIITTPLDTKHIIQNQKDYKDTIHDIFNNYPQYIDDKKPDNYLLNHHHDLIIGTPNKNNRLDIFMDKSKQIQLYDFSTKINLNNKNNKYDFMNSVDSVKISRSIPIEFKKQGLENLYKELDNYKPKTYEQHLDSFTQNY